MKRALSAAICALLSCAVLLMAGNTRAVSSASGKPSSCPRCACGGSCCLALPAPPPAPLPAAPANSSSLKQIAASAPGFAAIWTSPAAKSDPTPALLVLPAPAGPVTLFQRYCAFLI